MGIAGVSGSGKSSLALGVLYAEGSRRYLEALSTYTRRRMTQASKASVEEVLYVPAALALHQRPGVPGIRSTFGTGTELLNSLRLMYSRLASHRCPNGHYIPPTLAVAAGKELVCPECGAYFYAPSAEELAFNSQGACQKCGGTGSVRTVDMASLVPDDSLTIDGGAVAPWNSLMWSLMTDVCREMGVRTDVPFRDLTEQEKDIVYHGPAEKKHIFYHAKNSNQAGELDFTYYNAVYTVENALAKVKDDKGMKRVEKFLREDVCPECHGSRLSAAARAPKLRGISLDEACQMTLEALVEWVKGVPGSLPEEMRPMAESICEAFESTAKRLMDLGLGYLTLDRSASTLSTGERQRMQLARAVRNRTTGVLYVLDEPSIGLHPRDNERLIATLRSLQGRGNTVLVVEHDEATIREADHIIELGPGSGAHGGDMVYHGSFENLIKHSETLTAKYMRGDLSVPIPDERREPKGWLTLRGVTTNNLKDIDCPIPLGTLTCVTGVSGSGKSSLVVDTLYKHLALAQGIRVDQPGSIRGIDGVEAIERIVAIDQTPIGRTPRSNPATYTKIFDEIRNIFAMTPDARKRGYQPGRFSFNVKGGRCEACSGDGQIRVEMHFLPDVYVTCDVCGGKRYNHETLEVRYRGLNISEVLDMPVREARQFFSNYPVLERRLAVLEDVGLDYIRLGQPATTLSGGEAQRIKISRELGKRSLPGTMYILDEPTTGLHMHEVGKLVTVLHHLVELGATVVVIEHNTDVILASDYVIDLGPGGGENGGRIVAAGTPEAIMADPNSVTGKFLTEERRTRRKLGDG